MTLSRPLTIAYDAKRAVYNNTGLGNYSREVIRLMAESHPQWQLQLFTPGIATGRFDEVASLPHTEIFTPQGLWKHLPSLWRVRGGITSALRHSGANLFHGLSNELPLDIRRAAIPSVVTIHDVIYRRFPDNYSAIDRRIYDYKYGQSARNATRIVAISRRTAQDIVELYGVDPAKIDIIYQSCHPQFSNTITDASRQRLYQKYQLPHRYIAMVGTIEQRKNQMLAINALPQIDPEVTLVIVGRSRRGYAEELIRRARKLGVEERVMLIEGMDFDLLPTLYNEAELAAYPSRYEGFGLPVVEAISAGTPVIAATGSCLEEAGGPGAVYVHPDDADSFASEANNILQNQWLRQKLVAMGRDHIATTHSTPMVEALTLTYAKALGMR